jgi:asparagine synthase (glutamine-hydrolysing)
LKRRHGRQKGKIDIMCGLAVLSGDHDSQAIRRVLAGMIHRGPDGEGLEILGNCEGGGAGTFGHRRLAIIDPDGGRQPLTSPRSNPMLVANGMIYNYRKLRAELTDQGFRADFNTESDSETILHGYRHWGPDVAAKLDGMFAFVIQDGSRCVAARDPLGIKPLYWGHPKDGDPQALMFGSEIEALSRSATNIEEFPAGHVFDSRTGLRPYYQVPEACNDPMAEDDALSLIRETLERAVVKRLRSDVPLGCFLSGGLDSSVIAALAARHMEELHTFAVGLEGSRDLAAARVVADHIGSIHHEYEIPRSEIAKTLPCALRRLESYDRDLTRSAVPTYFVAREAARHGMKVVLTGEGADELFAGYSYYADYGEPAVLQAELRRSLTAMHDVNLQRVDRMTMAHSLEARVPFLDTEMIALGMQIPATLKQRPEQGCDGEKWVLRKAFESLLPTEIVWRGKEQFDEGSGFADYLANWAKAAARRGEISASADGRSQEESLYRHLLAEELGERANEVLPLTSHWSENREAA